MKRIVILLVTASALLAPSAALASGVVLKVQRSTHLVAVARTPKSVSLVHTAAASRLKVGQRIALKARTLRNGTLAASSVKVVGRSRTLRFRGMVLARNGSRLVVSAGGAVISLHRGSRTTSSARDSGPQPGSTVDVSATVGSNGELDEDDVQTVSASAPGGKIEGKLAIGVGTITVSSEHMSLVLKVPVGLDLTAFAAGDEVLATFSQGADGTLTLTAISGNGDAKEADHEEEHASSGDAQNGGGGDSGNDGSDDGGDGGDSGSGGGDGGDD